MKSPDRHSSAARPVIALAATAGLLLLAVFLARAPSQSDPASGNRTDEEALDVVIEQLVSTAQSGDIDAWLNCFAGDARSRHESSLEVTGRDRFAAGLRQRTALLRSYVTTNWQIEWTYATVELERVFAERNVRVKVDLEKLNGQWKITAETPLDEFSPEILYGTPVVPETPESK